MENILGKYVALKRKKLNLTQAELSAKAGVGLRFIRELERGKKTLRMDKVEEVLKIFGDTLYPVSLNNLTEEGFTSNNLSEKK